MPNPAFQQLNLNFAQTANSSIVTNSLPKQEMESLKCLNQSALMHQAPQLLVPGQTNGLGQKLQNVCKGASAQQYLPGISPDASPVLYPSIVSEDFLI